MFILFKRLIHGEWGFIFLFYCFGYWVIKDLGFCFLILLPHKNRPDHSSKTYSLYNQDIKSTKWQMTVIIEKKDWKTFKIIQIFYVNIDTSYSTKCIVSCQLDISRSYYFVWYGWYLHIMLCLISVPVWKMSLTWKIKPYFSMVLSIVGQHLSLWPAIKTHFTDREKLWWWY